MGSKVIARLTRLAAAAICVAVGGSTGLAMAASKPPQQFESRLFVHVADVVLGPAGGRIDYQSIDPGAKRLYISMMGAGKLLVFDTERNRVLKQLEGFPKVTGVLAVPALHRVYASVPGAGLGPSVAVGLGMLGLSSGTGAVVVVNADGLQEVARLPGGVFPDGLAFDAPDKRLFVSDELGSAVLAIDTDTNRFLARVAAGGEVGNVQYESMNSKLYAPIQSKNELAIFDPRKNSRIGTYPLPGCEHPHGLALATGAAIGFVACDANDILITIDLGTGKISDRHPVGHDPDVLAIDAGAKRLYVAGESGTLSTFDITIPASPVALGDSFVGADAHSVAVDPVTHLLYMPIADINGFSLMRILAPKR